MQSLNHAVSTGEQIRTPSISESIGRLKDNVNSVFLGKTEVVELALTTLLAEGHLLLEDVPGVGKTLLAKALSRSIACTFNRIQFTPDLLPGDLLGTSIFHQTSGQFVFQPGPMFAQVVLADEINRATPRTQSALLEAMSERQVTLDGQTRALGPPFFVVATQNPYEFEGTYPLPESQLDRFLMRIQIGYPDRLAEKELLNRHRLTTPVDGLQAIIETTDLIALQHQTRTVRVTEPLADYMLEIIEATRTHPDIALGASTRAALGLYRCSQSYALMQGRDYCVPDDVKKLVLPVLCHRIIARRWARGARDDHAATALKDILDRVAIPT